MNLKLAAVQDAASSEHQPPLDGLQVALRYLCAVVPMAFFAGTGLWAHLMGRRDSLLPVLLDLAIGAIGLVLMHWRRRWPWQIALATAVLMTVSAAATGPAQVAYVSLCTHRRWRQIAAIAAAYWLSAAVFAVRHGIDQTTYVSMTTLTIALVGLTVFGLYLRNRRDLSAALHEQEMTAERAQQQQIEQAKLAERAQIAREMHDVLAHRLSLLSMLAGGLAYRTDLTAEQTREAALAIQENAHQSLNELRSVLGTMRPDGGVAPPLLADLTALFEEVRAAGQRVEVHDEVTDRALLPAQIGRHVYRIVQEALTNARKHAPGARVRVELSGHPGSRLHIRVSNPAPARPFDGAGGRLGLVGLSERARMAGGSVDHAVRHGQFVLEASLPWET